MKDWILMKKGEEEKLVHPGNVENHIRAGWIRAVEEHAEVISPSEVEAVFAEEVKIKPESADERKARKKAEREAAAAAAAAGYQTPPEDEPKG